MCSQDALHVDYFLKYFFGHEHKHNGISSITAMLRILLYGQKEWDMKQIMFIESPLPYFVLKNAILYKRENITMYHNVSCTHRLHMHGNTLTLLYIPGTIQDSHAHLYVPCAIQDFHASIVLPKGRTVVLNGGSGGG